MFERYGYRRIETPIFEETALFSRAIGETTDIVQKEMYSFRDRGGREMTLRPEETAPVVRAYIEHKLELAAPLLKVYYWGPMFRYEQPQAGRSRQFGQLGVEAIGSIEPALDAEVIELLMRYLEELGLRDLRLHLNSVGDKACRPAYERELTGFIKENVACFCRECGKRAETNPMRVFDCKNEKCREVLKNAPVITDFLCDTCRNHLEAVKAGLGLLRVEYVDDPGLARGLDYYTRTAFEVKSSRLGAQDAVGAGGRYDYLVEQYGGPATPAIGFAIGLERLLIALDKEGIVLPEAAGLDAYVVTLGEAAGERGLKLLSDLRSKGVKADMDFTGKSLKGQMRSADRVKARFAVILGEEELAAHVATARDMATGEQTRVRWEELAEWLKK